MNIYDISRRAGVSIATVSRVLNNSPHVSENTRRKVLAVIDDTGYVPNAFARGLGLNTMRTIGLVCLGAADPYQAAALSLLEKDFREHGYDCLLTCTERDGESRRRAVEQLKGRHVDGMVLMGSSFIEEDEAGNDCIREAAKSMPMVLLNGALQSEQVYCALCDDQQSARDAALHLLDAGCRRILHLYHSDNHSGRKKLAGYREAHAMRGLEVDEQLLCFFPKEKSTYRVRDMLLQKEREGLKFDAVLASEDILAVGALKYAKAAGRSVPEDLCVMGYNDSNLCACTEPELSSVDNKLTDICRHIVTTMIGALDGKEMQQITLFAGGVVKRGSTR